VLVERGLPAGTSIGTIARMRAGTKAVTIFAALAVVTIGLITMSVLRATKHDCEVCMTYHDRTQCRSAAGSTREEAVKTATDNACAYLASGMTQSIQCQNTPPARVTCAGE
jgi:hypothetical protein